jgi:1-acyl-sn-glycerol-3-phosphate acyltransferase
MRLLRSALFNICFYLLILILMIAALPALFQRPEMIEWHARRWARLSLVLLDRICAIKVEYRGLENLPAGRAVVAAKHQSTFDVLALINSVEHFSFIYKHELDFVPLFGAYLRRCGQISVDRSKRAGVLAQIIAAAKKKLGENRRLIIFPEGTRRPVGAPPLYKSGVARLVGATGTICVPVALNSGLFWARRRFIRSPGTMVVEFLPPLSAGAARETFMQVLQTRIEVATDRLVAEAVSRDASLAAPPPARELSPG